MKKIIKMIIKQLIFEPLEMILAMSMAFSPLIIMIGVSLFVYSLFNFSIYLMIFGVVLIIIGIILISLWGDDDYLK